LRNLTFPDWQPVLEPDARILITGATGGLGTALIKMLLKGPNCQIGAHGSTRQFESKDPRVIPINKHLKNEDDCAQIIEEFVEIAGGIDSLVVLSGGIHFSGHWKDMPETNWEDDIDVNLNQPFYLSRAAMKKMESANSGGRILLTGTESAIHGGSGMSFPYAIAKRGTECMIQGLAREGAPHNILVNGLRFGYIASGFHQRWHGKSPQDMAERAELVPLKRGGHPDEAAALMIYLLSGWSQFITGQMIPLTGGDWL
jgi:NAD(P)-dependent dehydrogenase (short-subunit alcohol dehydrogenase family)